MKNCLRSATLLASAVIILAAGFSSTSACAADRDMVRAAQIRLADLGYFSGFYDGILGPSTKGAIKDFQRHSGITPTGKLTAHTYDLLLATDYKQRHGTSSNLHHANPESLAAANPAPEVWHYVGSQRLPVRNGELIVDEEANGAVYRYTVKLNGEPLLLADNQPGAVRISDVYHLNGEDAVVITTYRGEDSCTFKNYLVTIHENGASAEKHEFESCAPSNEVHEAFNALFVRFAAAMNQDGYDRWDVWRYEDTRLVRL